MEKLDHSEYFINILRDIPSSRFAKFWTTSSSPAEFFLVVTVWDWSPRERVTVVSSFPAESRDTRLSSIVCVNTRTRVSHHENTAMYMYNTTKL